MWSIDYFQKSEPLQSTASLVNYIALSHGPLWSSTHSRCQLRASTPMSHLSHTPNILLRISPWYTRCHHARLKNFRQWQGFWCILGVGHLQDHVTLYFSCLFIGVCCQINVSVHHVTTITAISHTLFWLGIHVCLYLTCWDMPDYKVPFCHLVSNEEVFCLDLFCMFATWNLPFWFQKYCTFVVLIYCCVGGSTSLFFQET